MFRAAEDEQDVLKEEEEEEEAVRRDLVLKAGISFGDRYSFSFTSSTWISPPSTAR